MAKKKKKVLRILTDYDTGTVYVQDRQTGKMMGRQGVTGFGDRTVVRRTELSADTKYPRAIGYEEGQILGRKPPVSISEIKRHQVKPHKRRASSGHPQSVRGYTRGR